MPEDIHRTLKARAAQRGQSLADYALDVLSRAAQQPTFEELTARIRLRAGEGDSTPGDVAEIIRREREGH